MPATQIPEKLSAGAANWNTSSQSVDIPLFTEFKSVSDEVGDTYTLEGKLVVSTDSETFDLAVSGQPIVRLSDPVPSRPTPLKPISFKWDRNGGKVAGTVKLSGSVMLVKGTGGGPAVDSVDVTGSVAVA